MAGNGWQGRQLPPWPARASAAALPPPKRPRCTEDRLDAVRASALLQSYAHRVRELRRADPDVREEALAPAFQQLLEAIMPLLPLAPRLTIVPEYQNPGV